jgi:phosphoribosylglycinamide formyltransferase-1
MASALPRIAVLASGRGSNLRAILDAIANDGLDADVVGVFSDRPGCEALLRVDQARRWSRDAGSYAERAGFDADLADAVAAAANKAAWRMAGQRVMRGAGARSDRRRTIGAAA